MTSNPWRGGSGWGRHRGAGPVAAALVGTLLILSGPSQAPAAEHPVGPDEACLECHDDLLAGAFKHSPAEEEFCDACHEVAGDGDTFSVTVNNTSEICLECHTEIGERMSAGNLHPILEAEACSLCHNPHSSDQPRFLLAPQVSLCGDCHDAADQFETGVSQHPPVVDPGCSACHEPHASPRPTLLRAATNDLCLACHGQLTEEERAAIAVPVDASYVEQVRKIFLTRDRTGGHPMLAHPVVTPVRAAQSPPTRGAAGPTPEAPADQPAAEQAVIAAVEQTVTKEKEQIPLSCLSCHEPHGSAQSKLMIDRADLCTECHE